MIWISKFWPGCNGNPPSFSSGPQPPPWHEFRTACCWLNRGLKWNATSAPLYVSVNKLNSNRDAWSSARPSMYKTRPKQRFLITYKLILRNSDLTRKNIDWNWCFLEKKIIRFIIQKHWFDILLFRSAMVDHMDWNLDRQQGWLS